MHHAIGIGLLVYLIGFAFGERTAQAVVAIGLIAAFTAFAYVMFRIITGTI
jgi:hypothetical protein